MSEINVTKAWVLSLMLTVLPESKHRESYDDLADAIATVSDAAPLFEGKDFTAALLVSLGRYESGFDPKAAGCSIADSLPSGLCKPNGRPLTFGYFQVDRTNFKVLLVPSIEAFFRDAFMQVRASLAMIRSSFRICRKRPVKERLAWYAGGTQACAFEPDSMAVRLSKIRVGHALALLRLRPAPAE